MLNKIEEKTIQVIKKTGFTFLGDSHFKSYRQAIITMNSLERKKLVEKILDNGRTEYRIL